jgi:hypothetical protein
MLGALSATLLLLAGCGSDDSYDNASRPPAPLNVSVNLTGSRVMVSPARIGAGPIVLLIANESGRSRDVTLSAPARSSSACVDADVSSGPINPQGTARVQFSVVEGRCLVGVTGEDLQPARLTVGPQRKSAQDDLLAP